MDEKEALTAELHRISDAFEEVHEQTSGYWKEWLEVKEPIGFTDWMRATHPDAHHLAVERERLYPVCLETGLLATGYYAAGQGVSIDSKGNLKIGSQFIPERATHAPWFEVFKMGLLAKQNGGNFRKTGNDITKTFLTNAPASEFWKPIFSPSEKRVEESAYAAAVPFVPQTFLELLKDIKKNTPKKIRELAPERGISLSF